MKKHYCWTTCRDKMFVLILSLCLVFVPQNIEAISKENKDLALSLQTVTASFKNASLNSVIWEIEKQTDFTFVYNTDDISSVSVKDYSVDQKQVSEVLDYCLANTGLDYSILGGAIAIKTKDTKSTSIAVPQEKFTVQGIILDNNGLPAIGAAVVVLNSSIYATTDFDGFFTLEIPKKEATLQVSFIGYLTQDIKADISRKMSIQLVEDSELLEEAIVTGYGTFKKSAYAGSASVINTKGIKDVPSISFAGLLQGAAPGIQISSESGQPGATARITIRGMGSFNASNSPLYVIDGIPVMSGGIDAMGSDAGLDIMSTMSSSDIENITILKDAAAASLYGSRAANGVIIITTKKGRIGKTKFGFKSDWGYSDFAMQYRPVMSGAERRDALYTGLIDEKIFQDDDSLEEATERAKEKIEEYAPVPWSGYADWDDALFKKGGHQNYEFSLSGATEQFSYYSSIGYLDQEGVALNSALSRFTGRVNVDYKATNWLTVGAKVMFSQVEQDVHSEGTSYTSPFYSSRNAVVPSDPLYNEVGSDAYLEDGIWNREFIRNSDRNPLLAATYDYETETVHRAFNTLYAEAQIIDGLKARTTFSYDYTAVKGNTWRDPRTSNGDGDNGIMSSRFYERKKMVWSNTLNYIKTFNHDHNFDALFGYEIDSYSRDYLSGTASNFATYEKNEIGNGMKVDGVGGSASAYRLVSYIARLNYNYKNKYFVGGSWRTDGSSRLATENRWGNFWSASAAWRIDQEEFMAGSRNWLSDLKLRASYGVSGTLPSDYYGYYGLSSLNEGYLEQPGIVQDQIANSDLSWETNYNFNVGLDMGFLDNRLSFSLEYYTRTTKNLLMDRPISMTTGFSSYLMNIGEVKNQGVELVINSVNFEKQHFSWSTGLTLGHNRNEIVALDGDQTEIISGSQIRRVGLPYRTFYLMEFAGINTETGMPQFYTNEEDENGNYIKDITEDLSDANYIAMEKADPDISGGISNSLRYRWFDLNFMFTFQAGGYSYDNWAQKTEHGGEDEKANIPSYYNDRWKKPGDVSMYERIIAGNDVSMADYRNSRRLHSTDFLRLKNLTFGITIPQKWTQKAKIESLRFYFSANNLLTWAKHDYYDPEAVSGGTAIWGTPPLKTLTFGLNINF